MTYTRRTRGVLAEDAVNSVMSWPVATVEVTDSLVEVAQALAADEIGAMPVLHDGVMVGVVSERDVTEQLGRETDEAKLTAGDAMSADPVTVPPEARVLEAARIMWDAQVRHLPVVSHGVIAGIVSMRDVFHVLLSLAEERDDGLSSLSLHDGPGRGRPVNLWLDEFSP